MVNIEALLEGKAQAQVGKIGFFGKSPRDLSLIVAPTDLIIDAQVLDEFRRRLLADLEPAYQINSAGSVMDYVGGLFYGISRFDDGEHRNKIISVRVLPDSQLARNILLWESGVGRRYPATPTMEGLARCLDKDQLAFLREDPQGFSKKLRRHIALMRKEPPNYGFLPIGGSMSHQHPFTGISIPDLSRIL